MHAMWLLHNVTTALSVWRIRPLVMVHQMLLVYITMSNDNNLYTLYLVCVFKHLDNVEYFVNF